MSGCGKGVEWDDTYASLLIESLSNQHEWSGSDLLDRLLVHDVQGRLVNQANLQSFLAKAQCSVVRPVQHITKSDDVSCGTLEDNFVFSNYEFVAIAKEFGPVGLQDVWNLGTGRKTDRVW